MTTETGRISSQAQGVNSSLLIHSNLERVATIAGAVASFALAIFALIGSEYLIAALSGAAGLSLLYSSTQGEGTAAVPQQLPLPETPVVAQQMDLNGGASASSTVTNATSSTTPIVGPAAASNPALLSAPSTSSTTATSSTQATAVPASSSLLPPVPAARPVATDSDEASFLRRRTPNQTSRGIIRTGKFAALSPEDRQHSDVMSVGSSDTVSVASSDASSSTSTSSTTESKHRRTQSDDPRPSNASEQVSALSATTSGVGIPRPFFPVAVVQSQTSTQIR